MVRLHHVAVARSQADFETSVITFRSIKLYGNVSKETMQKLTLGICATSFAYIYDLEISESIYIFLQKIWEPFLEFSLLV